VVRRCIARSLEGEGYVAIANRLHAHLDALWNERLQRYDPGPGATVTEINADLLLVHAVAAQRGLSGPVRDDGRARAVARIVVDSPLGQSTTAIVSTSIRYPGSASVTTPTSVSAGLWSPSTSIRAREMSGRYRG
jgi:hypothetical protein